MVQTLSKLDIATQNVMAHAACLGMILYILRANQEGKRLCMLIFTSGNVFHLQYLAIACDQTPQKTCEDLDKALRGEYVIRLDDIHFKFVHDRVQQAALSLVSFFYYHFYICIKFIFNFIVLFF